ncbi:hypothetical protein HPULCUR_001765 [Helicostylum pulchrum]|uniref:Uncharacterized protein n=1 Tax=Helicostylum pulchrum TaxID=562976 RepID=A0ABP9XNP0_9FUNG
MSFSQYTKIPNSFDPVLKNFLRSLQDDMKTFAGLVTANQNLTAENESLRAQVQKLQLLCENRKNADNSRTRGPTIDLTPVLSTAQGINASKYAPTITTPLEPTPQSTEWTQVVQRKNAQRKLKAPLSDRKRLATTRPFDGPPSDTDSPSGYEYVYIYRKHAMTRKDIRHRFGLLGVTTARVIDINFPAHSIVGILIHKEYKPNFKAVLDECKIPTIDNFDPTAGANIAEPKYTDLNEKCFSENRFVGCNKSNIKKSFLNAETRAKFSASLHQDRCMRTLNFIREYLLPSVSKFFIEQKWITPIIAEGIISHRMARPMKKRNTMNRTSLAENFINNHNTTKQSEGTAPPDNTENEFAHYGGGTNDNMDTTEEFDGTNAYGPDSDEELADAEDLSPDKPNNQ